MRILIMKPSLDPGWQSCVHIVENLLQAYRQMGVELVELHTPTRNDFTQADKVQSVVAKAKNFNPDHVVFLDHLASHLVDVVPALTNAFRSGKRPTLTFHLYGNFTLEPFAWMSLERSLKDFPTMFLCASTRQASLVNSFLLQVSRFTAVCPFPVDEEKFYFDPKLREKARAELGWQTDFVFLYTGRISCQKNVIPLLEYILSNDKEWKRPFKIAIAGWFDSLNAPLFRGQVGTENAYQYEFLGFLNALPKKKKELVQYLGPLSPDHLNGVYNAGDAYLSWSTYHDEDYGMAPAEALSTGLPCILSDWGGYSDFAVAAPQACETASVKIDAKGISLDVEKFKKSIKKVTFLEASERAEQANKFKASHSAEGVAKTIQRILAQRAPAFDAFDSKLKYHARFLRTDFGKEVYAAPSTKDTYYFGNYSHYSGQVTHEQ